MPNVQKDVLDANNAYAAFFSKKGKLPLLPGRYFAILTNRCGGRDIRWRSWRWLDAGALAALLVGTALIIGANAPIGAGGRKYHCFTSCTCGL